MDFTGRLGDCLENMYKNFRILCARKQSIMVLERSPDFPEEQCSVPFFGGQVVESAGRRGEKRLPDLIDGNIVCFVEGVGVA